MLTWETLPEHRSDTPSQPRPTQSVQYPDSASRLGHLQHPRVEELCRKLETRLQDVETKPGDD